jgi:hypothetical protein
MIIDNITIIIEKTMKTINQFTTLFYLKHAEEGIITRKMSRRKIKRCISNPDQTIPTENLNQCKYSKNFPKLSLLLLLNILAKKSWMIISYWIRKNGSQKSSFDSSQTRNVIQKSHFLSIYKVKTRSVQSHSLYTHQNTNIYREKTRSYQNHNSQNQEEKIIWIVVVFFGIILLFTLISLGKQNHSI